MLTEGFFHADPHPGQPALGGDGSGSTCSTSGWSASLDEEPRGLLLLLLLAFWREDADFLADVLLMLGEARGDVDIEALRADLAEYVGQFTVASFNDIELGPMLDAMIQIAAKHGIRLPASLAMTGKAFGQMQLAVAELDPALDPFSAVSGFMFRGHARAARRRARPAEVRSTRSQKLKLRATRLIEGIERLTGARPGPGLQIELRGSKRSRTRSGGQAGGSRSRSPAARRCSPPFSRRRPASIDPGCRSRSASPPGVAGLALALDLRKS